MTIPRFVLTVIALAMMAEAAFAQNGALKIQSFPPGAAVSVDGQPTGKVTPVSVTLAVGSHVITIAAGNGWSPDTRVVAIGTGNNDLFVTLLPSVSASPQGPQ